MRSFKIVDDAGFHRLMKTGCLHIRIPSQRTVACDVQVVFKRVKERIGKMLQVGLLDYSTWLYYAHHISRNTKVVSALLQTPRVPPTIVHLWLRLSILSKMAFRLPFFWILLRLLHPTRAKHWLPHSQKSWKTTEYQTRYANI